MTMDQILESLFKLKRALDNDALFEGEEDLFPHKLGSGNGDDFDESLHPRDDAGRFTESANIERWKEGGASELQANIANATCDRLGFDKADLSFSKDSPQYVLNGQTFGVAGYAFFDTGKVVLYPTQMNDEATSGVLAHEIMHHKFERFMRDYAKERTQVIALPNGSMKSDGTLNSPFDKQYRLYNEYAKRFGGASTYLMMEREDGLTDYSRQWWDAKNAGTASRSQAFHETMAEMARVNFGAAGEMQAPPTAKPSGFFDPKPSKNWLALYKMVNTHWDNRT